MPEAVTLSRNAVPAVVSAVVESVSVLPPLTVPVTTEMNGSGIVAPDQANIHLLMAPPDKERAAEAARVGREKMRRGLACRRVRFVGYLRVVADWLASRH